MNSTQKKTVNIILIVLIFMTGATNGYGQQAPEIYSIQEDRLEPIKQLIRGARSSILIATYAFTSHEIVNELNSAKRRGVKVEVIIDEIQAFRNKYSQLNNLSKSDVYFSQQSPRLISDFGIIDGKSVYTGGTLLHSDVKESPKFGNYIIFRDDEGIARRFEAEFVKFSKLAKKFKK